MSAGKFVGMQRKEKHQKDNEGIYYGIFFALSLGLKKFKKLIWAR
jgi:hypothetical protein